VEVGSPTDNLSNSIRIGVAFFFAKDIEVELKVKYILCNR